MGGQCFITAFIRNRELTLPPPHEPSGRNPESDILLSLRSNLILSFHSQLCLYVLSSVRIIGLTCRSIYCRFHAASHGACPRLVHSASCAAPAPLGTFFDHPVSCFVYAQHLLVAGPVLGLPHPFHTHTHTTSVTVRSCTNCECCTSWYTSKYWTQRSRIDNSQYFVPDICRSKCWDAQDKQQHCVALRNLNVTFVCIAQVCVLCCISVCQERCSERTVCAVVDLVTARNLKTLLDHAECSARQREAACRCTGTAASNVAS